MSAALPVPVGAGLRLEDLEFELPEELIAQRPLAVRDACRLLCVRRGSLDGFRERTFADLAQLVRPGDALVRNVTRVLPARLHVVREPTGGRCELLLLEPAAADGWWALVRPGRRLGPGSSLRLSDGTRLEVLEVDAQGRRRIAADGGTDLLQLVRRHGTMPLPPYVRRPADAADADGYQTVYARVDGSVAAPTAGLHFTPGLLDAIAARGVDIVDLVLHVGPGTFQPIRTSDPLQHPMHWERFEVEHAALARLEAARARGGRVVAVGTTVVRTLESVASWEAGAADGAVEAASDGALLRGRTRLYLVPPHGFRSVDALVTNFHLPHSTLLLLVDAFASRETVRRAYAHAVGERFRFYSYGDAMWIE